MTGFSTPQSPPPVSNRPPTAYEAVALPDELGGRSPPSASCWRSQRVQLGGQDLTSAVPVVRCHRVRCSGSQQPTCLPGGAQFQGADLTGVVPGAGSRTLVRAGRSRCELSP